MFNGSNMKGSRNIIAMINKTKMSRMLSMLIHHWLKRNRLRLKLTPLDTKPIILRCIFLCSARMLGNTHSGSVTTSVTNPMIKHMIVATSISAGVDIGLEFGKSFMIFTIGLIRGDYLTEAR